jgi:hypothetical protein
MSHYQHMSHVSLEAVWFLFLFDHSAFSISWQAHYSNLLTQHLGVAAFLIRLVPQELHSVVQQPCTEGDLQRPHIGPAGEIGGLVNGRVAVVCGRAVVALQRPWAQRDAFSSGRVAVVCGWTVQAVLQIRTLLNAWRCSQDRCRRHGNVQQAEGHPAQGG